jgi:hypothetical protein
MVCGVHIEIEFEKTAKPWSDVFVFETIVDGKPRQRSRAANVPNVIGGSYVGRGVDVLFAGTDRNPDLAPGAHTVVMRATIPGHAQVFETPPAMITLDCSQAPRSDAGASVDGAVAAADGGRPDALVSVDAAGRADDGSEPDTDDGCGCRLPGSRGTRPSGGLVVLLFAFLVTARRRRGRPSGRRRSSDP